MSIPLSPVLIYLFTIVCYFLFDMMFFCLIICRHKLSTNWNNMLANCITCPNYKQSIHPFIFSTLLYICAHTFTTITLSPSLLHFFPSPISQPNLFIISRLPFPHLGPIISLHHVSLSAPILHHVSLPYLISCSIHKYPPLSTYPRSLTPIFILP